MNTLLVVLMAFSGYLVRRVPVYLAWIQRISYFSYATDVLVSNEFAGLTLSGPGPAGGAGDVSVPGEAFVPAAVHTGLGVGGNMAVLLGMTLATRAGTWCLLELAARGRFL
jgi:hypothetical protein